MFWRRKKEEKLDEQKEAHAKMTIHYKSGSCQVMDLGIDVAEIFIQKFKDDAFDGFIEISDLIAGYFVMNTQEVSSVLVCLYDQEGEKRIEELCEDL